MRTKFIKTTGLILFVIGFGIFNALFFLSDYTLTTEIVETNITDSTKASQFIKADSTLIGKRFSSNINFVEAINHAFGQVNKRALEKYAITSEELDAIKNKAGETFDLSVLEEVFTADDQVSAFKKKAFNDYGNWLVGQNVTQQQLLSVADNINKYGIVNQIGFDRYQVKNLKYSLTKSSSISRETRSLNISPPMHSPSSFTRFRSLP
jgi:hypothetical protein